MQPYRLDPSSVVRSFNKAAKHYDDAAILPREVAARMVTRLDDIKINPKRILDVGCGTGFSARLLAAKYPNAQIVAVDIAENMLNQAKMAVNDLKMICADAANLPVITGTIDIVFSNLMLHWHPDQTKVIIEWRRVLSNNGLLFFSTFGPDTLKELRESWACVDEGYHVHAFVDMHDIGDVLLQTRFADPVMDVQQLTMKFNSVQQLLRDLKDLGAHNLNAGRSRTLTGKRKFSQMIAAYETLRDETNKVPATYEVIYGHAWGCLVEKTLAQQPVRTEVAVPVGAIIRN